MTSIEDKFNSNKFNRHKEGITCQEGFCVITNHGHSQQPLLLCSFFFISFPSSSLFACQTPPLFCCCFLCVLFQKGCLTLCIYLLPHLILPGDRIHVYFSDELSLIRQLFSSSKADENKAEVGFKLRPAAEYKCPCSFHYIKV